MKIINEIIAISICTTFWPKEDFYMHGINYTHMIGERVITL
jgi:hypothetical protein